MISELAVDIGTGVAVARREVVEVAIAAETPTVELGVPGPPGPVGPPGPRGTGVVLLGVNDPDPDPPQDGVLYLRLIT